MTTNTHGMTPYRDWLIRHSPPAIPNRDYDWQFYHKDYGDFGDRRRGAAETEAKCKRLIDEYEASHAGL